MGWEVLPDALWWCLGVAGDSMRRVSCRQGTPPLQERVGTGVCWMGRFFEPLGVDGGCCIAQLTGCSDECQQQEKLDRLHNDCPAACSDAEQYKIVFVMGAIRFGPFSPFRSNPRRHQNRTQNLVLSALPNKITNDQTSDCTTTENSDTPDADLPDSSRSDHLSLPASTPCSKPTCLLPVVLI